MFLFSRSLSLFFSQIAGSLGADGITSNCCVGAQRRSAETAGEAEALLQDGSGLGGGGCWPTAAGTGRALRTSVRQPASF